MRRLVPEQNVCRWLACLWLGLATGLAAAERRESFSTSDAEEALAEVAVFQQFNPDQQLSRMGAIEAGGTWYHLFHTQMEESLKWRTLAFSNSGRYLGYYETIDQPAELRREGIVYPDAAFSAESGDAGEGLYDSGNEHVVAFTTNGPPDDVEIESRRYVFVSSPNRVRPDDPGYRFAVEADRLRRAFNRSRYRRIHEDFSAAAKLRVPEETAVDVLSRLRMRLGDMERIGMPWVQSVNTAVFPVTFRRALLGLKLQLNPQGLIDGLWVLPFEDTFPDMGPHAVRLTLPFDGRWRVLWGGETRENSRFFESRSRRHAREFVIADRYGKGYAGSGDRNEDYFSFGRAVRAPADGTVVSVVDTFEDHAPGEPNPFSLLGNRVAIQHATNEVSVIGHLMHDSLSVQVGDRVERGQRIGRCGNSGSALYPSLYIHLQDAIEVPGGSGYRPLFDDVLIWHGSQARLKESHRPLRGEYVEGYRAVGSEK